MGKGWVCPLVISANPLFFSGLRPDLKALITSPHHSSQQAMTTWKQEARDKEAPKPALCHTHI